MTSSMRIATTTIRDACKAKSERRGHTLTIIIMEEWMKEERSLYSEGQIPSLPHCVMEMWLVYAIERDTGRWCAPIVPLFEQRLCHFLRQKCLEGRAAGAEEAAGTEDPQLASLVCSVWRKIRRVLPCAAMVETFLSACAIALRDAVVNPERIDESRELVWSLRHLNEAEEGGEIKEMHGLFAGFMVWPESDLLYMAQQHQCPPEVLCFFTGHPLGEETLLEKEDHLDGYTLATLARTSQAVDTETLRRAVEKQHQGRAHQREKGRRAARALHLQSRQVLEKQRRLDEECKRRVERLRKRVAKARFLASLHHEK